MSKIISRETADSCQSWQLPNVASGGDDNDMSMLTASQLEALQQQAYEEAYKDGFAEGVAAGKEAITAQMNAFNQVLSALQKPFNDLDENVENELLTLVIALVKQLVRREIKADPGQVMAVIREAIGSLPVASRDLRLHLHPEDAALVQQVYQMGEEDIAWNIVEDPLISRGGCKVITDVTQVDATLETRLTQLFAHVFGERQQDSQT